MQNFNVDISAPGGPLVFYAMQADSLSRFFTLTITDGGEAWDPPDGALWSVRFGAPQMPSGWYDTVEDATDATHPAVNVATGVATVATVEIAEQALESPGQNILCVLVTDSSGYQIASWPIILSIQEVPGLTAPEVTTYYNLLTEQVAQVLQNAQAASASATLAESWAVGGTGTREGEDTDNAEYWAQQAAESAQEAVGFRTFQGGAVLPINGDADLTQPLASVTAAEITVKSAKNRLDSVTVHGFTTQDGSGDPSPSNVREIKNAGECNGLITLNGSPSVQNITVRENTVRFIVPYTTGRTSYVFTDISNLLPCRDCWENDITGFFLSNANTIVVSAPISWGKTVEDLNEYLSASPLIIAWTSAEDTGKHYTGIEVTQNEDYRCTIVEINDWLHEGDTLETNVESEFDSELVLTGGETYNTNSGWKGGAVYIGNALVGAIKVTGYDTIANIACSALPVNKPSMAVDTSSVVPYVGQGGSGGYDLYLYLGPAYNTTELTKQQIKALYDAGTPIRVFYQSAAGDKPLQRVKRTSFVKKTRVLTGTETLTSSPAVDKTYFALTGANIKIPLSTGEIGKVRSNMFAASSQDNLVNKDYQICVSSGGNFLFYFESSVTSVEQAQQILSEKHTAGTPVTLEYELAESEVYADFPAAVENPKGTYSVGGEKGTTAQVFVSVQPTPEEIGALPIGGTAKSANKLASSVNIGSASFDGSQNITLAQMGAAEAAKNIISLTQNTAELGSGLLIEWGEIGVSSLTTSTPSGGFYNGTATGVTFKNSYASTPLVVATFRGGSSYALVTPAAVTKTTINSFTVSRGTNTTISGTICYVAIGTKA